MPDFRRNCFDWEIPRMTLLQKDLEKVVLCEEVPDTIIQTKQKDGVFSVNSCYKILNSDGGSTIAGLGRGYGSPKPPIWLVVSCG